MLADYIGLRVITQTATSSKERLFPFDGVLSFLPIPVLLGSFFLLLVNVKVMLSSLIPKPFLPY